ncbi:tetratricopeptide repeat protein [bacterium]|nr:tetratricopeptide repeat protein [bacterium]
MKNIRFIIVITLLILAQGKAVFSQSSAYERDFELARRFMLLDKYEEAVELLENLRAQNANDVRVIEQLKSAYFALKNYDRLIDIIKTQLANSPNNIALWIELGGIQLNLGLPGEARQAFESALDIEPKSISSYISISGKYQIWGYLDEGIEFLERAKKSINDPGAVALELGRLYELNKNFTRAIAEYLDYLRAFPDRVGEVKHRISSMGKDKDQLTAIEKELKKSLKDDPLDRHLLPVLAQIQMRKGDYEAALESYKRAETYENKLKYLPAFANELLGAGQYSIALKTAALMAAAGEPHFQIEAEFIKGAALRGLDKPGEAIQVYDELIRTGPPAILPRAYLEIGKIQFYDYKDYLKGEEYFDRVVNEFPGNNVLEEGLKEYLNALFKLDKIEKAKAFLVELEKNRNEPSDLLLFKLGEVFFLTNEFDRAKQYFSMLTMSFPRSFYLNDALSMLMLAQEDTGKLEDITHILYLQKIGQYENCLENLQLLFDQRSGFPGQDYLLWLAGSVSSELGKNELALSFLDRLLSDHINSFFASIALELKGDIYFRQGEIQKANEAYNEILMKYSDAVNLNNIRKKLRALETGI